MKNLFFSLLLVMASITTFLAQAPTFTLADFPFTTQDVPYQYAYKTTAVPRATVGSNQVWNYGSQTGGTLNSSSFLALTNPQLPALTHYDSWYSETIVNGFYIDYDALFSLNTNGLQTLGRHYPAQRYGIQPLTGNALDSLTLDEQYSFYTTPFYSLKFPMTMGTTWRNTVQRQFSSKLTLTAYGINRSTFEKRTSEVRVDSVVGWGDITVPIGTQPSIPYRCLLVNRYSTTADSFYLSGQLAPAALLQAFGLVQNQKTYNTRRVFYRAGELYPAIQILYGSNNFTNQTGFTANQNGQLAVATEQIEAKTTLLEVFPNPATAQEFHIKPSKQEPMNLTITNITGSVVAQFQLSASDSPIEIPLSQLLPKGVYVLNLQYTTSKTSESTKVVVE
ncbi:MAG: hypothetical protein RI894_490 [Bacteroidota bacterium]|jgi:hypothetical protein